jgi:hypothetical protein
MPKLSIRAASTSHGHDPLDLVAVLTLDHVSDVDDTATGPGRSAVSIRSMQDRHANKRSDVKHSQQAAVVEKQVPRISIPRTAVNNKG